MAQHVAVRGFTMIELLVVMTIAAILLAVGMGMYGPFIASQRASDGSNALLAGLQLARSEAIRRNTVVVVCRTLVPQAAQPVCSNDPGAFLADDWGAGWVVFAKADPRSNSRDFDAGDTVLLRQAASRAGAPRLLAQVAPAGTARIAYRGDGSRDNERLPPGDVLFAIDYRAPADALSGATRCLAVGLAGTVRSTRLGGAPQCA